MTACSALYYALSPSPSHSIPLLLSAGKGRVVVGLGEEGTETGGVYYNGAALGMQNGRTKCAAKLQEKQTEIMKMADAGWEKAAIYLAC